MMDTHQTQERAHKVEELSQKAAAALDEVLAEGPADPGRLIGVLQHVQERLGHVPPPAIPRIADALGLFSSQVYGVLTFYSQFRLEPVGDHIIRVCHGTACHVGGAESVMDATCEELGVTEGGTTPDRRFTVEKVFCVGSCSLGPVLRVDEHTYGRLNQAKARRVVQDWLAKTGPADRPAKSQPAGGKGSDKK